MVLKSLLMFGFVSFIAFADADQCKIPRYRPPTSPPSITNTDSNKLADLQQNPSTTTTEATTTTTTVSTTTTTLGTTIASTPTSTIAQESTTIPSTVAPTTTQATTTAKPSTTTTPTTTPSTTPATTSTVVATSQIAIVDIDDANITLTESDFFSNMTDSQVAALIQEAMTSTEEYHLKTCPGYNDPVNHTMCCSSVIGDTVVISCCSPEVTWLDQYLFFVNDQVAMMIAIGVTAGCFLMTVLIIICCCWSPCPLYTACRIKYRQDDIIAYATKDEETAGLNEMPPEEKKGVTVYSPNAVKVTMKEDV